MSPTPSLATALPLSSANPIPSFLQSIPREQLTSLTSGYLFWTGGLLSAVVAFVSIAAYFRQRRMTADGLGTGTGYTCSSTFSWFSYFVRLPSQTKTQVTAPGQTIDLEMGPEHADIVYARHFHPMFWKVVVCYPPTTLAPAIRVEEEMEGDPASDPRFYGMNTFLHADDNKEGCAKDCTWSGIKQTVPYETSAPINTSFSSDIIGTTVRHHGFLSVPGQYDDVSEDFDSNPETFTETSLDSVLEDGSGLVATVSSRYEPCDASLFRHVESISPCPTFEQLDPTDAFSMTTGVVSFLVNDRANTPVPHCVFLSVHPAGELEEDLSGSFSSDLYALAYDGIETIQCTSTPRTQYHGMADYFSDNLKDYLSEEDRCLVPTISLQSPLAQISKFATTNQESSHSALHVLQPLGEELPMSDIQHPHYDHVSGDHEPVAAPQLDDLGHIDWLISEYIGPDEFAMTGSEYCIDLHDSCDTSSDDASTARGHPACLEPVQDSLNGPAPKDRLPGSCFKIGSYNSTNSLPTNLSDEVILRTPREDTDLVDWCISIHLDPTDRGPPPLDCEVNVSTVRRFVG